VPEKGVDVLIRAYQGLDTTMKLVIVGDSHHDKAHGADLRKLAADCDNIVFAGPRFGLEKEALLSHAAMLLLPSFIEGMSIVLLEGMSRGLCCLVSDIPENLEVVEGDEMAGATFRVGDAKDLAAQLKRLLDSPEETARLGQAARSKTRREYSWDAVAQTYSRLFVDLAGSESA
jgi:glycosyltransferase involved in cell wall biosynthesis